MMRRRSERPRRWRHGITVVTTAMAATISVGAMGGCAGMTPNTQATRPTPDPDRRETDAMPQDRASVPITDPEHTAITEVVDAVYATISGPAGAARDWGRFRSLLDPDARLVAIVPHDGGGEPTRRIMTVDDYVSGATRAFATAGFFERGVFARVERYGHIAHVFSTYESRRSPADAEPFDRGINSIQLVRIDGAWRVLSIVWDSERTGGAIPAAYLGDAAVDP